MKTAASFVSFCFFRMLRLPRSLCTSVGPEGTYSSTSEVSSRLSTSVLSSRGFKSVGIAAMVCSGSVALADCRREESPFSGTIWLLSTQGEQATPQACRLLLTMETNSKSGPKMVETKAAVFDAAAIPEQEHEVCCPRIASNTVFRVLHGCQMLTQATSFAPGCMVRSVGGMGHLDHQERINRPRPMFSG